MQTIGNVCPSSKSEESQMLIFLGQAVMGGNNSTEVPDVTLPRKLLVRKQRPVPQTDTGSRGENLR